LRAYGAGIVSSPSEARHATSGQAERLDFDLLTVFRTPYRIDIVQPVYFVIDSFEALAAALDDDIAGLIDEAKRLGDLPARFETGGLSIGARRTGFPCPARAPRSGECTTREPHPSACPPDAKPADLPDLPLRSRYALLVLGVVLSGLVVFLFLVALVATADRPSFAVLLLLPPLIWAAVLIWRSLRRAWLRDAGPNGGASACRKIARAFASNGRPSAGATSRPGGTRRPGLIRSTCSLAQAAAC
jgi:hypothetical protein